MLGRKLHLLVRQNVEALLLRSPNGTAVAK
jgi:hypothetical protein